MAEKTEQEIRQVLVAAFATSCNTYRNPPVTVQRSHLVAAVGQAAADKLIGGQAGGSVSVSPQEALELCQSKSPGFSIQSKPRPAAAGDGGE